MLVSSEFEIANGRILREIGRISATSGWRREGGDAGQRERALMRLIEAAKDLEADAIIGVDYSLDGARTIDLGELPLQRVEAHGIAVKLVKAA